MVALHSLTPTERADVQAELDACLAQSRDLRRHLRQLKRDGAPRVWRLKLAWQLRALDRWISRYQAELARVDYFAIGKQLARNQTTAAGRSSLGDRAAGGRGGAV